MGLRGKKKRRDGKTGRTGILKTRSRARYPSLGRPCLRLGGNAHIPSGPGNYVSTNRPNTRKHPILVRQTSFIFSLLRRAGPYTLYPEARACRGPTTEHVLRLFALTQRYPHFRRGNQVQTFHPELAPTQSQTLHSAGQYPLNRSCAKTPISKMGEKIFGGGSFGRRSFDQAQGSFESPLRAGWTYESAWVDTGGIAPAKNVNTHLLA